MNRRARFGIGTLLTAGLLAAALPVHAQQPHALVPFEGSHTFRNMLHMRGLKPLASAAELEATSPSEAVLIVFGDLRGLDEVARRLGGLDRFRRNGGAILIATDRAGPLDDLGLSVSGSPVRVTNLKQPPPDRPLAYSGELTCPVLYDLGNLPHPILQGLHRGLVTNQPSFLRFDRDRTLLPLVHFPAECSAAWEDFPATGLTCIAAPRRGDSSRVLVIAGHGIFMNGMLALPTDNFWFARNCIEWLSQKGQRKYALFIEEGRITSSFDVPLVQLPLPPLRTVGNILHGLEKENFFNRLVLDNVPRDRLLRYLFLGGSGVLLFYGMSRLVRAHHRGEASVPHVAAKVEQQTAVDLPLVARRQAAVLREGNCYEAARDLARLCFEGDSGDSPPARPVVLRGGRRLRRDVERLWRLAYGATPMTVSPAEFTHLSAQAARVQAALHQGALRFENTHPASRGR